MINVGGPEPRPTDALDVTMRTILPGAVESRLRSSPTRGPSPRAEDVNVSVQSSTKRDDEDERPDGERYACSGQNPPLTPKTREPRI